MTTNPARPQRGAIARAPAQHHWQLSEKEPGAFWRKLDEQGAPVTTIAATKPPMLTMTRQSELLLEDKGSNHAVLRRAVIGSANQRRLDR